MPTLNAFHSSSGSIFAGGATLEHDANTGLEQSHDGKCHWVSIVKSKPKSKISVSFSVNGTISSYISTTFLYDYAQL